MDLVRAAVVSAMVLFAVGARAEAVVVPWDTVTTPIGRDTPGIVSRFTLSGAYGLTELRFEEAVAGFSPILAFGFLNFVGPAFGPTYTEVTASTISYIEPTPGLRVEIGSEEVARVSFRTDGVPLGQVPVGLAFDRPVNAILINSYYGTTGWRVTPVPLPAGLPLLIAGMTMLGMAMRRSPRG